MLCHQLWVSWKLRGVHFHSHNLNCIYRLASPTSRLFLWHLSEDTKKLILVRPKAESSQSRKLKNMNEPLLICRFSHSSPSRKCYSLFTPSPDDDIWPHQCIGLWAGMQCARGTCSRELAFTECGSWWSPAGAAWSVLPQGGRKRFQRWLLGSWAICIPPTVRHLPSYVSSSPGSAFYMSFLKT